MIPPPRRTMAGSTNTTVRCASSVARMQGSPQRGQGVVTSAIAGPRSTLRPRTAEADVRMRGSSVIAGLDVEALQPVDSLFEPVQVEQGVRRQRRRDAEDDED